jgi:anti-sigma regulatory factor (Ser/Thr protein kinase)
MHPPLECYRYENLATQDNVSTCVEGILAWATAFGEKSTQGCQASIIAEELALNCATHGIPEKSPLRFSFEIDQTADGLRFIYEDNASEFNPLTIGPNPAESDLKKAHLGGWGLGLVLDHSKNLKYTRTSQGFNRLEGIIKNAR